MFVKFAVEACRFCGQNLGTAARDLWAGAWLVLAVGGILGLSTVVRVPKAVEQ